MRRSNGAVAGIAERICRGVLALEAKLFGSHGRRCRRITGRLSWVGGGAWGTMSGSILDNALTAVRDGRIDEAIERLATDERALWLLVVAMIVLDVYTTSLGLSRGLSEGNPLMRRAFDSVGFVALAAAKVAVLIGALGFRQLRPDYGPVIALGLAIPWTLTVIVNTFALAMA